LPEHWCTPENPCIECQREHAVQKLHEEQTEPELTPEEYEELLWQESPYEAMYYAQLKEEDRQAAESAAEAARDFAKDLGV